MVHVIHLFNGFFQFNSISIFNTLVPNAINQILIFSGLSNVGIYYARSYLAL